MRSWWTFFKQGLSHLPPEDRMKKGKTRIDLRERFKNLKPFVSRHWKKGFFGMALVLFSSFLAFPVPLIIRYLVDHVILAKRMELLITVVVILAVVKLMELLTNALQRFYFARFEQEILLDIQHEILERTLKFPKSFFDSQETGYLMSRIVGDVNGLRYFFSSIVVFVFTSILRLLGGIVVLLYLKWQLALVVLVVLPSLVILVRFFARKIHILSHHYMEQQARVSSSLQESLASSTLVKSFSTEDRTVKKVIDEMRTSMNLGIEQTTVSSAAGMSIGIVPEIARVLVLLAGAYWIIIGDWTLGSLLAFRSYVGYVFGPAQFLANANLRFQNAIAALERVSALFDIVPEEHLGKGKQVEKLKGEVEFDKVSFSYGGDDMVLDNVNLKVKAGEKIAIVGPSGIGKTTLLSLILCFYKPTKGEIRFDGLPVSEYDLSYLRKRIGYVSQDTELLTGTIMENLCYGNPDASQEKVIKVAKVAGIHDFIMDLDRGYDSLIGERGVNLSVGQKQRLSIARALIKDPDILILDEPASALDSVTEHLIFRALPNLVKDKTQFIVAHHMVTVKNARRILLLNDKKLVGMGSHQELIKKNEFYRALIKDQMLAT